MASEVLAQSNREILALAVVLPEALRNQFADERAFIDEFRGHQNIRLEYITAQGHGPFDNIESPHTFFASPQRYSRFYRQEAMEEAAIRTGADTILVGGGGEVGATCWSQRYYVELAVRMHWLTLVNELILLKKRRNGISPIRFLAGQFRASFGISRIPRNTGVLIDRRIRVGGEAARSWECRSTDHRKVQLSLIRNWQRVHSDPKEHTTHRRARLSYPLLDKRVLEFCLAAPGHLKVQNGYQRNLIRRALHGVLPEAIKWRASKFPLILSYYARYNAQLPNASEFVLQDRAKRSRSLHYRCDRTGEKLGFCRYKAAERARP